MFDKLLSQLNISLCNHGAKQIKIPNIFAECISNKNDTVIRNWLWDVPGYKRWRVTRMDAGQKLQVLNTVGYPNLNSDQPIIGIDLLFFGVKKKLVAVLDFQPLIQDEKYFLKYLNGLKALNTRFNDFNSSEKMSIYDSNKYFSPWVLFFSGNAETLTDPLPVVFEQFLDTYWKMSKESNNGYKKLTYKEVENLHLNYDIYNAERDPAHGLFKSYFGKEWADNFLENFLFLGSTYKN